MGQLHPKDIHLQTILIPILLIHLIPLPIQPQEHTVNPHTPPLHSTHPPPLNAQQALILPTHLPTPPTHLPTPLTHLPIPLTHLPTLQTRLLTLRISFHTSQTLQLIPPLIQGIPRRINTPLLVIPRANTVRLQSRTPPITRHNLLIAPIQLKALVQLINLMVN